ncbi:MAG: response regulator transcription factor [Sphaerochaeta sp.]
MISVLIADDQELIRESLELIISLDPRFQFVGSAKDGREVVELAQKLRPDVILMDIRMPEINGLECVKLIKQKDSSIKIIILTTFDDDQYVYEAVKYGADGFLLKGISKNDLLSSIATVHSGGPSSTRILHRRYSVSSAAWPIPRSAPCRSLMRRSNRSLPKS